MDDNIIHKIYNNLENILRDHCNIEEIGFLHSLDPYNESFKNELEDQLSQYIFYSENRLAIQLNIIPSLFKFTNQYYHQILREEGNYEKLDLNTKIYIVLNSKNYTIWNRRKSLIESCQNNIHKKLKDELKLIDIIQTKSPKSWEIWAHRRWVLKKMINFDISHEIKIIEKASIMHKRNYYSWSHRLYLMENMDSSEIESEIKKVFIWRAKNISDCSSLYYLYTLMQKDFKFITEHLSSEFSKSQEYIFMYPQRSSWWIYRRHLWHLYLIHNKNYNDEAFEEVLKKIGEEEWIVNQSSSSIPGHIDWILYMIINLDWTLNKDSNKHEFENYKQRTRNYLSNINNIKTLL